MAQRVRLQLQGELQSKQVAPRKYKGVFHGVSVILRNEGAKGLFRGIGVAVSQVLSVQSRDAVLKLGGGSIYIK